MEERVEKLEKTIGKLISENSELKKDISLLKNKIAMIEKKNQDYSKRIIELEKKENYAQVQNKLTNAPKLEVKHNHTSWITTLCLINGRCIISGSKDCSIKCLQVGEDEDNFVLFSIDKAHDREIKYIMKMNENEIISCGDDGTIKRWFVDCKYSFDKNIKRYELIETFTLNNSTKVHQSAYKIIKLKNGNLCSCGKDFTIKFWEKNKESKNMKIIKY